MRLARRLERIDPFYVMEVAKMAAEWARGPMCDPALGGRHMVYLNIGEPDQGAPEAVRQAAQEAIASGHTAYTAATGTWALRQAIARWTSEQHGVSVDAERVVVTAGASAALQLAMLAAVDAGDEVLMPDPSYPCNRHFVAAADGVARLMRTDAAGRFQPTAQQVSEAWTERTRGVLLATPSNPTGTSIEPEELRRIRDAVRERGGWLMVDEIYLGLSYDERYRRSALALGSDIISINSFSKTFGMTGWRLGWLVVPPEWVGPLERLAQNLYICPSAVAQEAALACFTPQALAEAEQRRLDYRARRDFTVDAVRSLGWELPVVPDGAFYAWIRTASLAPDSWDLCLDLIRRAQVVLTPGRDFGPAQASQHLRLSFASSMADLRTAFERLADLRWEPR